MEQAYRALVELLKAKGLAWVIEEVEQRNRAGKEEAHRIGRETAVRIVPYTAEERLVNLVDGIRHAVIYPVAIRREIFSTSEEYYAPPKRIAFILDPVREQRPTPLPLLTDASSLGPDAALEGEGYIVERDVQLEAHCEQLEQLLSQLLKDLGVGKAVGGS